MTGARYVGCINKTLLRSTSFDQRMLFAAASSFRVPVAGRPGSSTAAHRKKNRRLLTHMARLCQVGALSKHARTVVKRHIFSIHCT